MILFPAIDLYQKQGVRLYHGDYSKMTVYAPDPLKTAMQIKQAGASWIHIVDLEGAKDGTSPNFDLIASIASKTGLKVETGGGIRTMDAIEKRLDAGIERVILGTKAATDEAFLIEALKKYGSHIAAGVDAVNGKVMIHGWQDESGLEMKPFLLHLKELGVSNCICTDISKDGAMQGTNLKLYQELSQLEGMQITASGGISSLEDLRALKEMHLYGAVLGKAMYTGAVDLKEALKAVEA